MNILVDKLPTDYEGLKINTNFRSFILFELLMQDRNVDKEDKIALALDLFYDEFPQDIKKAFDGILWFYTRGKDRKEQKNGEKADKNNKKKIYSFEHDADLIYTAFLDQYRLDLIDVDYLLWFKCGNVYHSRFKPFRQPSCRYAVQDGNRSCSCFRIFYCARPHN